MDSGWLRYHADESRSDEVKIAFYKFDSLDYRDRRELKTILLPDDEYECGVDEYPIF